MYSGNAEPTLREMLEDPIVRLRMRKARLDPENVRDCLAAAKRRLDDRAGAREVWRVRKDPSAI